MDNNNILLPSLNLYSHNSIHQKYSDHSYPSPCHSQVPTSRGDEKSWVLLQE